MSDQSHPNTQPGNASEALAAELMAFHDCCTQNAGGGDGEFRIECSSGSDAQARALRAVLREAAAALRAPAQCGVQISDDALFNIATEAWSSQVDASWSTDGLEAAILAVREALLSPLSSANQS